MGNRELLSTRRAVLGGGSAILAAGTTGLAAPTAAEDTNAPRHIEGLFGKTGNFDLGNPRDLLLARTKAANSLAGIPTHIVMMTRHMLAPPGKVPMQIFAEIELIKSQISPNPDGPPMTGVTSGTFTRIPVDPFTFEPIDAYYNPYLGKHIAVEHTKFGGSGLLFEPDNPAPNLIYQQDEPHYRMGDDIAFVMFDEKPDEGPHQPQVDSAIFRVNYDALMDPATASVPAIYSYTSILRASVFSWTGIEEGDETQVLTLKEGQKIVGGPDALPREFKDTIGRLYPERI